MNRTATRSLGLCLALSVMAACSGSSGDKPGTQPSRPSVSYDAVTVGPGADCTFGGVRVDMGIDDNGNGALDGGEVDSSEYVCNGAPGALVDVTPVPAGVACAAGGLKVRTGVDANSNAVLDPTEVRQTEYVCNGLVGAGSNMLVRAAAVPPGSDCPNGGYLIQAGIDDVTANGQLEPEEVDASSFVCNGTTAPGSVGTLVNVVTEPAGSNCQFGGVKIEVGVDDDGNATLTAPEVDTFKFVCNAAPGASGVSSLVRMSPVAAGADCAAGGFRVQTGTDDDRNGTLGDNEVDATQYACNGASLSPLVRVLDATAAGGSNPCTSGGVVIQTGLDLDHNGQLGASEVSSSEYLCDASSTPEPGTITPIPLTVAPNGIVAFSGTLDTSDTRLPDGTRADFYSLNMAQAGVLDLSAVPAGAVEFHVFTNACLSSSDLAGWSSCFIGSAPRQRVSAGQYVIMVKGTATAYLWGTTHYDAILRRTVDGGTGAATLAEHVTAGITSLEAGISTHDTDDFLRALDHFATAANLIGVDTSATAAQVNQARFFGALARVLVVMKPYSDLVPNNGLDDMGDILDGFGLGGTRFQRSNLDTLDMTAIVTVEECGTRWYYNGYGYYPSYGCWYDTRKDLKPFPADSPRGQDLQAFLANHVKAGLDGALTLLNGIDSFSALVHDKTRTVELDYTDALMLKAVANGMAAWIEMEQAYDLDVDIDELRVDLDVKDDQGNKLYSPDDALAQYPFFGRLKSAATLPSARTHAIAAVGAFRAALVALKAETLTDPQTDDLFTITDETCSCVPNPPYGCNMSCTTVYNPVQQIDDMDRDLAVVQGVLNATGNYVIDRYTPGDTSDDVTVNASKFFAGVDLRSLLPSNFHSGRSGDAPGMLPDVTFGGILVSSPLDLASDKDADGSPDFLDGYSYFYPGYLYGKTMQAWDWSRNANLSLSFGISGNAFQMTSNGGPWYNGTWSIDSGNRNILVLTFSSSGPFGEKTMRIEADDHIDDDGFQAWDRRANALGAGMGDVQVYWRRL